MGALGEPLLPDDGNAAKMKYWQGQIFLFTFVNYAFSHWTRKGCTLLSCTHACTMAR